MSLRSARAFSKARAASASDEVLRVLPLLRLWRATAADLDRATVSLQRFAGAGYSGECLAVPFLGNVRRPGAGISRGDGGSATA